MPVTSSNGSAGSRLGINCADLIYRLADQALKAKIRRLEGARLPSHIKKERLFEVRYFDALPT